jgi:hypothetical protein
MTEPTSLLVATVKNEGPNILEWVAHHRLCGFDRIQIYQNDSTDTTVQTLRTLDRLGVIEYFDNRHNKGAHQMRAYRRAARTASYDDCTWCMVLDGDEFLSIKTGDGKVSDLIATAPEADAFLVNWRVFGSNGHRELGRDLVIERFTQAEPASDIVETHLTPFKPLFRTSSFARPGIHLPRDPHKPDFIYANGSGLTDEGFFRKNWRSFDPEERKFAQVNHYAVRDLASFLLKHDRGSANAPHRNVSDAYWVQHDRNEEEDLRLAGTAPKVWAEMQRLDEMSDGQLLRLRNRAFRQWRIGLDALLERPIMAALRNTILAVDQGVQVENSMIAPFRLPGPDAVFSSIRGSTEDQAAKPVQKSVAR